MKHATSTTTEAGAPKVTRFKVTDGTGATFTWAFYYLPKVYCTAGPKHHLSGWMLATHDGVERFSEGNWLAFVPFVRLIAGNYGFTCNLS